MTTNDAGPGRPVGPPLDPGGTGTRGAGIRRALRGRGRGSGRRVPVLAADPEDDRDGAEPGDDTGDEVEGHDAALLTLVGWSMRRPQMTPSIVIPQPWSSDATRIVPVSEIAEGCSSIDVMRCGVPRKVTVSPTWTSWEGTVTITTPPPPWRPHGRLRLRLVLRGTGRPRPQ